MHASYLERRLMEGVVMPSAEEVQDWREEASLNATSVEDPDGFVGRIVRAKRRLGIVLAKKKPVGATGEREGGVYDVSVEVEVGGRKRCLILQPGDNDLMSLMSHSCIPNCELDVEGDGRAVMRTKVDVSDGEELTWSYEAVTESQEEASRVRCCCAACRKIEWSERAFLYTYKAIPPREWARNVFVLAKAVAETRVSNVACREMGFFGDPMFESLAGWQKRYVALMAADVGKEGDVEGLWRLVELLSTHALCLEGAVAEEPFFSVAKVGDGYQFQVVDYNKEPWRIEVLLDGGERVMLEKGYAGAVCVLWHTCNQKTPVRDMMKNLHTLSWSRPCRGGRPPRKQWAHAGKVYRIYPC